MLASLVIETRVVLASAGSTPTVYWIVLSAGIAVTVAVAFE